MTTALVILFLATSLVALAPPRLAAADSHQPLRGNFFDMEVDEERGRIFMSRGSGSNGVLVTDLKGNVVTTIAGLGGASGMEFSEDRTQLYVALADDLAIAIVDATTLAVDLRPLPSALGVGDDGTPLSCPVNLAVMDDNVWFTGCDDGVGSYRPSTRRTISHDVWASTLFADPLSSRLYTTTGTTVRRYDVSGILAPVLTERAVFDPDGAGQPRPPGCEQLGRMGDLTLVPDRNHLLADNGVYLDRDDLHYVGAYPCPQWVRGYTSAAVRADGMFAVGNSSPDSSYWYRSPEIQTIQPGASTPLRAYHFRADPDHADFSVLHAMQWGRTRLYALVWTVSRSDPAAYLRVIRPRPATSLTIRTRYRRYDVGEVVKVRIRLRDDPHPPRRVLVTHRGTASETVGRRVEFDESGRATFRFRMRNWMRSHSDPVRLVDARINDDGDLVYSNRLQLLQRGHSA